MTRNLLFIICFLSSFGAFAQPYKTVRVYKPYKWMLSADWSAIDDDGSKFTKVFDFNNSWNVKPFPTRLTLDRYFIYGWSAEGALSYAEYTTSKLVNDSTGISGMNFSFDLAGKYSFYQLYAPSARWIDPYLTAGIGYTYRTGTADTHVPTVNIGGGVNFWFVPQLGIRISSQAKFGVYPKFWDTKNNYLQHTAGIVFRTKDNRNRHRPPPRRKQHKWTKKTPKKFKRKGGQ